MSKNRTLLCISSSICPTIYINKHLALLDYGGAPAKGSNPIVTLNRSVISVLKEINALFQGLLFLDEYFIGVLISNDFWIVFCAVLAILKSYTRYWRRPSVLKFPCRPSRAYSSAMVFAYQGGCYS